MTGSVTRWQSYGCTDTNKWFVRWAANGDSLMLRPVLSQLKLQFKVGGDKSHKSTRMWTWFWLKYNLLCSFPQFLSSWQTYCFGSLFSLLYKSCFGSTGCVVGVHYYLCYRVIYNLLLLPSGGQKYLLSQFKLTSNVQTLELENLCSCACLCGGANENKTLNPVVPVRQACFEMVATSPDVILILPQDETCWCTQLLRREPEESLPTCPAKMR